jgi:hypothetical protein
MRRPNRFRPAVGFRRAGRIHSGKHTGNPFLHEHQSFFQREESVSLIDHRSHQQAKNAAQQEITPAVQVKASHAGPDQAQNNINHECSLFDTVNPPSTFYCRRYR